MITCGQCDSRWSGANRCHCAACCTTFGGVTAFDAHRIFDDFGDRVCLMPEQLGLHNNGKDVYVTDYAGPHAD